MNAQMQAASLPIGNPLLDGAKLVRSARAVIATEARAIEVLHDRIDGRFLRACQLMFECSGRVVVSGMGKSGHIARKIAATLASTGTPSFFVHPGEASHGDLGMITPRDVVLALSNSGETDELLTILPLIKRQGIPLIVMSGNSESSLARLADVHLDTSVPAEACPYQAAIGGPAALTGRVATMATCALTLRYDRATGTATFPLHCRQPGKVGHAAGMYTTIPVGVFQPSGEAKWNEANDFSLWRGLLREYAEELLGADEDHGSEHAPIDYAAWPLARAMTDGLADGTVRAWCLGLGADPLTFAPDLLAVVVIDAPLYDNLFGGMVDDNAEGRVIKPRLFDAPSVTELVRDAPLQAATAALLTLALTHRATLLAD